MADIKLVAIDLDGTLLNSMGKVSIQDANKLREASNAGIRIVISTTRNHYYTSPLCQELGLSEPLICANGAQIYASPTGSLWMNHTIPIDVARKMAQIADKNKWEICTTVGSTTYWRQRKGQKLGFLRDNIEVVKKNEDAIINEPLRILTWQPNAIKCLIEFCSNELSGIVRTEAYYAQNGEIESLGIFHAMANKGDALLHVLEKLSISQKNAMAIGDNTNDLEMFSIAEVSVAMGNGTKEVKKQADAIAPSNNNNGVAWALDKYILDAL